LRSLTNTRTHKLTKSRPIEVLFHVESELVEQASICQ
jgi:hypothetical protein